MPGEVAALRVIEQSVAPDVLRRIHESADAIISAKERGGKVAVVTGAAPTFTKASRR